MQAHTRMTISPLLVSRVTPLLCRPERGSPCSNPGTLKAAISTCTASVESGEAKANEFYFTCERGAPMQLVLCDLCRKNTNKEVPVGTMTRTYKKNVREGGHTIVSQEFVTEILPMTTVNDNQERLHVCIPCFSGGMTDASKALTQNAAAPEKSPA